MWGGSIYFSTPAWNRGTEMSTASVCHRAVRWHWQCSLTGCYIPYSLMCASIISACRATLRAAAKNAATRRSLLSSITWTGRDAGPSATGWRVTTSAVPTINCCVTRNKQDRRNGGQFILPSIRRSDTSDGKYYIDTSSPIAYHIKIEYLHIRTA